MKLYIQLLKKMIKLFNFKIMKLIMIPKNQIQTLKFKRLNNYNKINKKSLKKKKDNLIVYFENFKIKTNNLIFFF